jgi:hypothetical protein
MVVSLSMSEQSGFVPEVAGLAGARLPAGAGTRTGFQIRRSLGGIMPVQSPGLRGDGDVAGAGRAVGTGVGHQAHTLHRWSAISLSWHRSTQALHHGVLR